MIKQQRGFTLVEVIMAIVIAAIISAIFATVISVGMNSWIFLKGQRSLMADTRAAVKRMVREIRRTNDSSAASIVTFTSREYEFIDLDNNTIEYKQLGTELARNGAVLLSNLDVRNGLDLQYLDKYGTAAVTAGEIRTVQVTLNVVEGNNVIRLRSAAAIRNR